MPQGVSFETALVYFALHVVHKHVRHIVLCVSSVFTIASMCSALYHRRGIALQLASCRLQWQGPRPALLGYKPAGKNGVTIGVTDVARPLV
jgi:hypothetical protein